MTDALSAVVSRTAYYKRSGQKATHIMNSQTNPSQQPTISTGIRSDERPDLAVVRATVAILLVTERTPRGLRELGSYSATYGPLDSDPDTVKVAAFYDAVEREYWRQCAASLDVKIDPFDILFDRSGDVCIAEGEQHVMVIPGRVVLALASLIETDNRVTGWLDRIHRQINPEQPAGASDADLPTPRQAAAVRLALVAAEAAGLAADELAALVLKFQQHGLTAAQLAELADRADLIAGTRK